MSNGQHGHRMKFLIKIQWLSFFKTLLSVARPTYLLGDLPPPPTSPGLLWFEDGLFPLKDKLEFNPRCELWRGWKLQLTTAIRMGPLQAHQDGRGRQGEYHIEFQWLFKKMERGQKRHTRTCDALCCLMTLPARKSSPGVTLHLGPPEPYAKINLSSWKVPSNEND